MDCSTLKAHKLIGVGKAADLQTSFLCRRYQAYCIAGINQWSLNAKLRSQFVKSVFLRQIRQICSGAALSLHTGRRDPSWTSVNKPWPTVTRLCAWVSQIDFVCPFHGCCQSSVSRSFPAQEHVRSPGCPQTNWNRTVSITRLSVERSFVYFNPRGTLRDCVRVLFELWTRYC